MIELNVNGTSRKFDGEPDMPLLWYLRDLLELTAGLKTPQLRNPHLARELNTLACSVDSEWVMRAIAGVDELAAGARRNLNRQLGLDAMAASLAPHAAYTSLNR